LSVVGEEEKVQIKAEGVDTEGEGGLQEEAAGSLGSAELELML